MGHIKFLLKFGEESHLKEFAKGSLYCSNAETFWGIEDKQKIKGQGDILEAGSRIFSQNMTMQSLDTGSITSFNMSGNILVHLEPAKHIPVFCLFTVYEDDCGIPSGFPIQRAADHIELLRRPGASRYGKRLCLSRSFSAAASVISGR